MRRKLSDARKRRAVCVGAAVALIVALSGWAWLLSLRDDHPGWTRAMLAVPAPRDTCTATKITGSEIMLVCR